MSASVEDVLGLFVAGRAGDHPDARGHDDLVLAEAARSTQLVQEAPDYRTDSGEVRHVDQEDRELVAPEASRRVRFPQLGADPLRHLDQQFVADKVPQAVVQALEVVEVQPQHCVRVTGPAFGLGDGPGEVVEEQDPVGQAGQAVVEGLVA